MRDAVLQEAKELMGKAGLFLILICCGGGAFAQNSGNASTSTQTRPILLNVQVTDKAGQPIADLKQSDFTVFDDGKPVPIQLFRAMSASQPDVVSIVLLIDNVNAGFNSVTIARQQIAKFLRSYGQHLPAPVSISVLTDSGVTQLLAPLNDGTRLAWELEQTQAHLRPVPAAADWGTFERWQDSIRALGKITKYQLQRPGRTLLIWVGPGWSVFDGAGEMITDREQAAWMGTIVAFSTALREARITLYQVDPLGLQDGAGILTTHWEGYLKPVKKQSNAYMSDLALQVLATQSGGKVLFSSNDAAPELAACAEDGTAFYAIRFNGQTSTKPNTWHDVAVKVDRPGLVIRTSNGYYAQP